MLFSRRAPGAVDEEHPNREDHDRAAEQRGEHGPLAEEQCAKRDGHHWVDVGVCGHRGDGGFARYPSA